MSDNNYHNNVQLAAHTALNVGGPAEQLATVDSATKIAALIDELRKPTTILGFGANVLISDKGLPGLTILVQARNSGIQLEDDVVVADAAVWWDDLVAFTIEKDLWGMEMMSFIPGGVGAAIVGNIAAYGQAVKDTLQWVDVLDSNRQAKRLTAQDLDLDYRTSGFQTEKLQNYIILQAGFKLSKAPTMDLTYHSARKVAEELRIAPDSLKNRRRIIQHTRLGAGSIYLPDKPNQPKTAGSFFRNPIVSAEQAKEIVKFDESGWTEKQIAKQNEIHGGSSLRVSAAHVLLAAGFKRGQSWGPVRLHPDHVLKIENTGGATAQQIYDVAQEIIATTHNKLGIKLTPEVRFIGEFTGTTK